jgi:putative peptide zinc metalloprotease protein
MAPVRIELLLPLILAVIGTGCLHELSHAVTLAAMGGRPTRMGIMLLLGMPAFFCDVTDGWRIGERWRRAAVALAGPALHLLLAAASFALLLAVEAPPSRSFLILYGCACGAAVVANLIPLLKLDGYLALVAITDTPHLRANAIEAMRRAIARIFFQVDPRPGTPRDSPWFVAFGLLCAGFPLLLFVWAAVRLQPMFLGLGPWMAVVYLVLVLTFVIVTAWRVARFIAGCLRDRPRIPRAIVAPAVLSAAVLLALLIPTPTTARAGFVVRDDHPLLIVTSAAMLESVMDGARVRLLSNGIVLRPEVGTAVVDGDQFSAVPIDAPLEAVGPITDPGVTVPALALHLTDVVSSDRLPGAGAASIDQHSRPAGAVLLSVLVVEPLQTIFAWARS